jgi:hypothetical protein
MIVCPDVRSRCERADYAKITKIGKVMSTGNISVSKKAAYLPKAKGRWESRVYDILIQE